MNCEVHCLGVETDRFQKIIYPPLALGLLEDNRISE